MKNLTLLKKKLLQKNRERGLTLIEVGLAVLISAIIIIGVMYMYNSTSGNSDVFTFDNDMTSIRAAATTFYNSQNVPPTDIADLITGGYLSLGKSKDGTQANPWAGSYIFTPTTGKNTYTITADNIPANDCARLIAEWKAHGGSSVSCANSKFSAMFTYQ